MNRLREALGDSAHNPRFVETLPRRGSRFIGQVATNGAETSVTPKGTLAKNPLTHTRLAATAVLAIGVLLGGGMLWRWRQAGRLTKKDTIVLADFVDTTGDAVFDGTLRQGLGVQLEQSPFLSLVPEEQIQQTLRLMKQPPDARLTPEVAREICQRTYSAIAVDGSVARVGMQYSLILRAVDCANRESLTSTEAQASDKSHILEALGKASSDIRKKLGNRWPRFRSSTRRLCRPACPRCKPCRPTA